MAEHIWTDLQGRPLKREQLDNRIAGPSMTGVRSVLGGHPAQGLTPVRLANILRQAEQGDAMAYLELAEEMEEKDLHYAAVLGKLKETTAQEPIRVKAADDSAEARRDADLLEMFLQRDELQDEIVDIMDAAGKGWSVTEIVWDTSSTPWIPKALERVDQRFLEFDPVDAHTLRLKGDGGGLEDLAAAKFIIHRAPKKSGTTVRGGLARAAAWHFMFKSYSWKDWVSFLETYGMPVRLGRYDNGETEENKRILLNALAQLGSDAAAMFPKTMEVEFVDAKAGTAPSALWMELIDKCDEYLSKLVLGQTNTTDAKSGGLGSGQANVHKDVEDTIVRAHCRRMAVSLNRDLVVPLILLNHGPRAKYPKLEIGREDPVDVVALTNAASTLVPMGVRVSKKKMGEIAGLPEAEDDDDLLMAPGQASAAQDEPVLDPETGKPIKSPTRPAQGLPAPTTPEKVAAALLVASLPSYRPDRGPGEEAAAQSGADARDAVDDLAEAMLDDWEELIEPVVAGIESALDGADSLEAIRAALIDQAQARIDAALIDRLAAGGMAARLAGELDVQTEQDGG